MKKILLPHKEFALVDDDVFEKFGHFKWSRKDRNGYVIRGTGKTRQILHHVVLGKPKAGFVVDHINGNTFDNRRENLRFVTFSQSAINRRKFRTANLQKGIQQWVDPRTGWTRYRARIQVNKKAVFLGFFVSEKDAVSAYKEAAKKYHREHASIAA